MASALQIRPLNALTHFIRQRAEVVLSDLLSGAEDEKKKQARWKNLGVAAPKDVTQCEEIVSFIKTSRFKLPYTRDVLNQIMSNWELFGDLPTFACTTVLHLFASWMTVCEDGNPDDVDCMMKGLAAAEKSAVFEREVTMSAMFYCITTCLMKYSGRMKGSIVEWFEYLFHADAVYPRECFMVLGDAMTRVSGDKCECESQLYFFTGMLCEEKKGSMSTIIAEMLFTRLTASLLALHIPALECFSHLSGLLAPEIRSGAFEKLASAMLDYIMARPVFIRIEPPAEAEVEVEELPPLTACGAVLCIWQKPAFLDGINWNITVTFPETVDLGEMLEWTVRDRLTLLMTAVRPASGVEILEALAAAIRESGECEKQCDLIVAFLFLCHGLKGSVRKEDIEVITSEPIFDPRITVFNEYAEFELISSLRQHVLQAAFDIHYEDHILMKWIRRPQLFTEIVHRVIGNSDLLEATHMAAFSKTLMKCSLYYQQLHYQEEKIDSIERARTSMLLLISRLFVGSEYNHLLFSSDYFVSFFMSFVFEENLRGFVCERLRNYFLQGLSVVPDQLFGMLERIIIICTTSFPGVEFIRLVVDLLTLINEALTHNHAIKNVFGPLCGPLFLSLEPLTDAGQVQKDYVIQCIQFFAIVATFESLGQREVTLLRSCIECMFDEILGSQIEMKLIQLIAGDYVSSMRPTFNIRHPLVMKMLLELCLNDPKLVKLLDFIDQLVRFSRLNTIRCQEMGIDLMLLTAIRDQTDDEILCALLKLFETIAVHASSVAVVERFVSLMLPVNGKYIPRKQVTYLRAMSSIIQTSEKVPSAAIAMIHKTPFAEISGINGPSLDGGFTLVFWLFLEASSTSYKPVIVEVLYEKGCSHCVFLSGDSLLVFQKSGGLESTGKIIPKVPVNEWTFIALTFWPTDAIGMMTISAVVDSTSEKGLEFQMSSIHPGPVTFRIAGLMSDSVGSDQVARLGPFGCYPMINNDEIAAVMDLRPRVSGCLPGNPIFFYAPDTDSRCLTLQMLHVEKGIVTTLTTKNVVSAITFAEVLIDVCHIRILMPLFAQLDMKTEAGEECLSLAKMLIDLFEQFFMFSSEAQESFYTTNCCGIVAHLLRQASETHVTFALYQRFYKLVGVIKHQKLQRSFVHQILMEPEIWMRADAENHTRIVRHWGRIMVPSMVSLLANKFQMILFIMRAYYWYHATNEYVDMIKMPNRVRNEKVNIHELRQSLVYIAVSLAMVQFNADDFRCLVSHCVTCSDSEQVIDLLVLYKDLVRISPSPLARIAGEVNMIAPLYLLLPRQNPTMAVVICEIFAGLHKDGLQPESALEEQTFHLIRQLSHSIISISFFEDITRLVVDGAVELFPVWCWMAATERISDEKIIATLKDISSSPGFRFANVIWPIVAVYLRDTPSVSAELITIMCTLNGEQWRDIYGTIEVIGKLLELPSADLKTNFFDAICNIVEADPDNESQRMDVFMLAQFFLYSRDQTEFDPYIAKLISTSPFRNQVPERREWTPFSRVSDVKGFGSQSQLQELLVFRDLILSRDDLSLAYCFGIHRDENGDWRDRDLALRILRMLDVNLQECTLTLDLMLSVTLLGCDTDVVMNHLGRISPLVSAAVNDDVFAFVSMLLHRAESIGADIDAVRALLPIRHDQEMYHVNKRGLAVDRRMTGLIDQKWSEFRSFAAVTSKRVITAVPYDSYNNVTSSRKQMFREFDRRRQHRHKNAREWSRLWQGSSSKPLGLDTTPRKICAFTRDPTACRCFCPAKLRRNCRIELPMRDQSWDHISSCDSDDDTTSCASVASYASCDGDEIDTKKGEERALFVARVIVISVSGLRDAYFRLFQEKIELNYSSAGRVKVIPTSWLAHIFMRRILHRQNAIEIFTDLGKSFLISFVGHKALDVVRKISSCSLPVIKTIQTAPFSNFAVHAGFSALWIRGQMSNFEYLMQLNTMSGRTFNDVRQYPIFPWVISDYKSTRLDLSNQRTFRSLDKPVGALNAERLRDMENEREERQEAGHESDYIYASCYSHESAVCGYLERMEPFHGICARLEGCHDSTKLDSIAETYERVTTRKHDVRELTPEFYFCPEFLIGRRPEDENVVLPPWAESPIHFVYKMRQALESDCVSRQLHLWIDMMWGISQRGRYAHTAKNLFRPEMYDGIWNESNMSEQRRHEVETHLMHVGQIPPQLFRGNQAERHCPRPNTPVFSSTFAFGSGEGVITTVACIEISQTFVYKISVVNEKGTIITHIVDLSNKRHGVSRMARHSSKQAFNSHADVPSTGSTSNVTVGGVECDLGNAANVKTICRNAAAAGALGVDVFARRNSSLQFSPCKVAVVSHFMNKLFVVDIDRGVVEPIMGNVVEVGSNKDLIAVTRACAVIDIYRGDLSADASPWRSIPSYGGSISCSCISKAFLLVVVGTSDGSLILNSLTTGATAHIVDLDGAGPYRVVVTDGWGFIVVFARRLTAGKNEELMLVFTVNGELITSREIDSPILTLCPWTSPTGFDYIVCADENGKLFAFEVLFCNIGEGIYRCRSPLTMLIYSPSIACIVAVTQDGRILFVPYNFECPAGKSIA